MNTFSAEYRPPGATTPTVIVRHMGQTDNQFILNAAAWLREMWHVGTITVVEYIGGGRTGVYEARRFDYDDHIAEAAARSRNPTDNRVGKARRDHGATAKAAAYEVAPRTGSQRARILNAIVYSPRDGVTRDELAYRLDLSPNTVRPRVRELVAGGWIVASDVTRSSDAGRPSEVLKPTAKALARGLV